MLIVNFNHGVFICTQPKQEYPDVIYDYRFVSPFSTFRIERYFWRNGILRRSL